MNRGDSLIIRRELRAVSTGERDRVIRLAYSAGLTKMEIHKVSGIARSTIDRVLSRAAPPG